jgi:hypothetical protein
VFAAVIQAGWPPSRTAFIGGRCAARMSASSK